MTDEAPPPLKSTGETPAELVSALRALARDDRDAARLARVAERLGAEIAATGGSASLLRSLTGTKMIAGLVVGLGAVGVLGYALIADRAAAPAQAPAAPAPIAFQAPAPVPAAHLPAQPRELEATEVAAPAAPVSREGRPRTALPSERGTARARQPRALATDDSSIAAPAAPAGPAEQAAPAAPAPASTPDEPQARPQPAVTDVTPSAQLAPPPPRPTEAALLHRARKLASQDPEAALRLLDEHARSFPGGILVPERELLSIEVLRTLGRDAEAERRVRQFEARYPRSLHLRRLERTPPAGDDI